MRVIAPIDRATRTPDLTARVTQRTRPRGFPLLSQTWSDVLFLHWRVPVAALRPLVPPALGIDTHQGGAWVGLTAFHVEDSHPRFAPPLPWISDFFEVNVRTYVHFDGVPGVWFFSLDADSRLTVDAARAFFHLPYHFARIVHAVEGERSHFQSSRSGSGRSAELSATWSMKREVFDAVPGSLEFFWAERYCLFSADENTLYRARVFHEPWPIREVSFANYDTSLLDVDGLRHIGPRDRAHALAAGPVHAEIWPLEPLVTF